jgi:hypothetical protein
MPENPSPAFDHLGRADIDDAGLDPFGQFHKVGRRKTTGIGRHVDLARSQKVQTLGGWPSADAGSDQITPKQTQDGHKDQYADSKTPWSRPKPFISRRHTSTSLKDRNRCQEQEVSLAISGADF